ncbi:hypothetical protein QN277_002131 [Acacia crassicarpa]|uniref:DUF4005 domain-containing protein n=1 Tax=Acacia crassicarpa TaxID=499986 RepID=A0AAE1NA63_9FABA|nr:hypothetical protein QN277_002131 [Acacia crassicarpa]
MGKKSWFSLIKRLFRWGTQSEQGKKEKRMKIKRLAPIAVPSKETTMLGGEEDEEQRKNALSVKENSAAIRIQAAFRGYLARKALRALKGIVKLQAIIRGRAVRRQALRSLKCLQSIVSIQSQVSASRRLQMLEGRSLYDQPETFHASRDKIIKMDSNSEKRWDDSILLKEEVETTCMSKKEALLRRERIKQYSFNHRMSAETERNKVNGRWRYWLEQWVDTQLSKSKELEDLDSAAFSSHYKGEEHKDNNDGGRSLKLRNPHQRQNQIGEELNCHSRQCSSVEIRDDYYSFTSSPVILPTYMAPTESAKAKARSISSPRLRAWNNLETDSDYSYSSPCKKKPPLIVSSSVNTTSEVFGGSNRIGKLSGSKYKQMSPRLKSTVSVMNKA